MDTTLRGIPVSGEKTGDGIAAEEFDQIVRLYQQRIYRILLLLLADRDAADTLTQECFLRAFKQRTGFRREASLQTWLVRIAVNLAHDHRKNRRRAFWKRLLQASGRIESEEALMGLEETHPSPERALLAREELLRVWTAVERLSQKQRTIFLLRFVEEMSLAEIAQTLKVELGTVKSHLFRAIGMVRSLIKEQ